MKHLIALVFLATSIPSIAGEITFKGASWDSLAIPLRITPFYIQIDHPASVTSVSIEMEMFIDRKLKKTISSGGLTRTDKAVPLKVNAAIYFMPPRNGEVESSLVIDWGGSSGVSRTKISESEFPISKGVASGAITEEIKIPGRTPIFRIMVGDGGFTFPADPLETPQGNPGSTVFIGYLKTK
jgi:hypothetical protein